MCWGRILVCHLSMIISLTTAVPGNVNTCTSNDHQVPACSQICVPQTDGYTCQCKTGYQLANDNKTCLVQGSEANLYLISQGSVSVFNIETGDLSTSIKFPGHSFTDLAFGPTMKMLLLGNNGTVIYETTYNNTHVNVDIQPIIDAGLQQVTSVVSDWLTSNIYLVDKLFGRIVVCTNRGENCSILLDHLQRPDSLTVHADSRSLFWCEWSVADLAGGIHSVRMDGEQARVVVGNLNQPYNLLIDSTVDALYWIDRQGEQYIVQTAKLTGDNKREIIRGDYQHPHIAVLEDNLYLTDGHELHVINKFTGHVIQKYTLDIEVIGGAYMYHDVLYNTGNVDGGELTFVPDNPCVSSPCSHICIPNTSVTGYRCLCRVDEVADDAGACVEKSGEEKLLVSGMSGIYEVSFNYIGYHGNRKRKILHDDVSSLVYDWKQGRIFYFADARRAILKTYLHALQNSLSVYSDIMRVEDMAFDASSQILYWTTGFGDVHAGSVDGAYSTTIITNLDKPRGITLDPETGYLYICDWGHVSAILQCHMDGTHCITFHHVDGGHPNMIVISTDITMETESHDLRKTLYWTDSKLDMIGYLHLDGVGVSTEELLLKHNTNSHPYSISVSRDRIYFTDWNTKHLHYIQGTNLSDVIDINIDAGTLYSLASTSAETTNNVPTTLCATNNGGCSHLCLIKPNKQKTCLTPPTGSSPSYTDSPLMTQEIQIQVPANAEVPLTMTPNIRGDNTSTLTDPGTNQTRVHIPDRHTDDEDGVDTSLLAIFLIIGIIIIIAICIIVYILVQRKKHQKRNWMLKLIHYVKTNQSDDGVGLVSNSTSTISSAEHSFKHFEDVDYSEDKYCLRGHGNDDRREISIVSVDSAFNEMREFDNYGSAENFRD